MRKKYEELEFTDDFMFCKILTANPNLCKGLLELILDIRIKKIIFAESQKTIEETYDGKGVRLDVYVDDEAGTIYDLEMQTTKQTELPKRMRYYQGMIDLNLIERGAAYSELKRSYIIFICLSDPFEKRLPVYSFRNACIQDPALELGDDTHKVIINADGKREGLSQEMRDFLDYIQKKGANSSFTQELQKAVDDAIAHRNWEVEYMTLNMKLMEEREEGRKEGIEQGIRQGIEKGIEKGIQQIIVHMLDSGTEAEKVAFSTGIPLKDVQAIEASRGTQVQVSER